MHCECEGHSNIRILLHSRRTPFETTVMPSFFDSSAGSEEITPHFDFLNLPDSLVSPVGSRASSCIYGHVESNRQALPRRALPMFPSRRPEISAAQWEVEGISDHVTGASMSDGFSGALKPGPPIGSGFGSAGDNRWGPVGMRPEAPAPVLGGLWSSLEPASIWATQVNNTMFTLHARTHAQIMQSKAKQFSCILQC